MVLNKPMCIAFVLVTLLLISTLCFAQNKGGPLDDPLAATQSSRSFTIDLLVGAYTFVQPRHDVFVNGYIEFFPDHRWTFVVHFDDDRDQVTDRFEVFEGSYAVRKNGPEPEFVASESGRKDEAIQHVTFMDKKVEAFSLRGFGFNRRKSNEPYFDHALNARQTAKSLKIETDPAGAIVYMDGVRVSGHTPLVIERPVAGRPIALRIERSRFSERTDTVQLNPDEAKSLAYKMVNGESELWIATTPWTRVILDGRYRGNAPLKLKGIKAGKHKVILENNGAGISQVLDLELPEGEILKKVIHYTGKLDLFVGRECKIINRDGKVVGNAPAQGLKFPVGNQLLRLEDKDKMIKIITVRIHLDQVTTFNEDWDQLKSWKD